MWLENPSNIHLNIFSTCIFVKIVLSGIGQKKKDKCKKRQVMSGRSGRLSISGRLVCPSPVACSVWEHSSKDPVKTLWGSGSALLLSTDFCLASWQLPGFPRQRSSTPVLSQTHTNPCSSSSSSVDADESTLRVPLWTPAAFTIDAILLSLSRNNLSSRP